MVYLDKKYKQFTTSETEITNELIEDAILMHQLELVPDYLENENMYLSDHEILHEPAKPDYKPDNRIVVNASKYIVDTFEGYRMGNPIKVTHEDEAANKFISDFRLANDMQDKEPEVSKDTSMFGHSFFYLYQDEDKITRVAYESPIHMFMVYDDSIEPKKLFAVRYGLNDEGGVRHGEVITSSTRQEIMASKTFDIALGDITPHIYPEVPVVEVLANEEREALIHSTKTLVNAINKAMSAKADDVEFFSESILKILGVEASEEDMDAVSDSRILNLYSRGENTNIQMDAEFMEKPSADATQENLIERAWEMIFTISMVANISDENFGANASGISMEYKMQAMSNLAKVKDRKFESALNELYRVVFSVPTENISPDEYKNIKYTFTPNVPRNIKEEAEIMNAVDGHVSNETKLTLFSPIDDPKAELESLVNQEFIEREMYRGLERQSRHFSDGDLNDKQTEETE